jgi:predicted transcriptional regulator
MVSNKEVIIRLYFEEKLRVVDISKNLDISKSAVTQVLQKDRRYLKEKELRKKINQKRNKEFTKNYIANKRKQNSIDIEYALLRQAHEQASRELSGGRKPINNRAYRDWNSSIYKYDEKTKSYVLRKNIIVGSDVPKRIKWMCN